MQLTDKTKYGPALLMIVSLIIVICITGHTTWFIWYWITVPIIMPLCIAVIQLTGKLKSQVIPVSGAITSVVPIPLYLESLRPMSGTDGQAALIFAVIPIYQLLGLVILSVIGYSILAWRKKHGHL
ncbi:hypothetical protein E0Z06_05015 [Rheinheimera sp. D18]|uniref:hypothetical protein n=1 Tax=Rheinheimera sp. D18 TaxID=2545632 RepID=UPI00104CF63D|nr:hypothetical protein [Rheinheimera sp. D18]QBL08919.1 hypothetical protein E0Z06_05015 [Rheinheimera sp. D18]